MRIHNSIPSRDAYNTLMGLKNTIAKADVVVLPHNYRHFPRCVEEKGMAQALGKEIWFASRINEQ